MDYEHKDALDRARNLHKDAIDMGAKDVIKICEIIFPELAESEDERIRKAIVEFFELQDDNTTYSFIHKKDILAWLEKQGKGSLTALLAQMPCCELVSSQDNKYRVFWKDMFSAWHESAIDACVELLERVRKEEKINYD